MWSGVVSGLMGVVYVIAVPLPGVRVLLCMLWICDRLSGSGSDRRRQEKQQPGSRNLVQMATRSEREKALKLNEQHQAILSRMLREDDNKYCADCEAKGPRWASWNIGVFICIRCAGIHRNLGVHISKVKSVNLDQWTPEQIQCMQDMGNTKARIFYEANLPENFRRPQTDQSVEFFIRDKYERKKYYDKSAAIAISMSSSDAAQPLASSPSLQAASEKNNLEKEKKKEDKKKEKEIDKPFKPLPVEKTPKKEEQQLDFKASPKKAPEPTVDLLGLDGPAETHVTNGSTTSTTSLNDDLDIFGPMMSNPLPASSAPTTQGTSTNSTTAGVPPASMDLDLFTEKAAKSEESAKKQLSKDSILSLYGTGTISQQNAPGMFLGPSTMPFPSQPTTNFQAFPPIGVPLPTATGIMGNMMGQSMPGMGQSAGMMVGMGVPNGFVGSAQTGVMGLPPTMIGPQAGMVGSLVAPQNKYGMQQNQQASWNVPQVNQQMGGMSLNGPSNMMPFGQPANTVGGWASSGSGQTLSTQLWK